MVLNSDFHTMDVVVSAWATLEMGPVGLTSVKLASLMKNSLILVTKHCKKKKKRETHKKEGITICFFPSSVAGFFFITPWITETASTKAKKKIELSREDHVSSKVGFLKFCYLLFLANNNENSNLKHRNFFL